MAQYVHCLLIQCYAKWNGNIEVAPKCCSSRKLWIFKMHRQNSAKIFNTYFFFFFETYVCHFYRLFSDYPHLLIVSSGVGRVYRMIIFIMACVFCTSQIFSLWNKSDYFIHFHYIKIEKAYKICSTKKSLIWFSIQDYFFQFLHFSFRSFCIPFKSVLRNSLVLCTLFRGTKYFPYNFIYLYFIRSAKQVLNNIDKFHENIHIDTHAFK